MVRNSLLIVQLPVGESAEYIKDIRASAAGSLSLLNQFRDYEAIREHLIIRPLNYDDNEKALAKAVYRRVGDVALVLYISLGKVDQGGASNILSAMVTGHFPLRSRFRSMLRINICLTAVLPFSIGPTEASKKLPVQ